MIDPWCSVQSVFYFRPVSIAVGWWTLSTRRYNYSVLPLWPCIIFRVAVVSLYNIPCCRCVPGLRQGHKSKNETRISLTLHGLVFSRIHFFVIFRQWYLDFGFDLAGFASAWGTSFLVYDRVMYSIECYYMLFRKKRVPQALANPRKSW